VNTLWADNPALQGIFLFSANSRPTPVHPYTFLKAIGDDFFRCKAIGAGSYSNIIERLVEEAVVTVCIAFSRAVIVGKFNTGTDRYIYRERETKREPVDARGGVVVEVLRYKSEGRGFDS
jgi:hypothetical protein